MSFLQKIYEKLPEFGQNMMVSAYGCRLYYERHYKAGAAFSELLRSQWLTSEQIKANQLVALKKLLVHAGKTTPYYKELFSQVSFNPGSLQSIDELECLPLLKKETIRTKTNNLISTRFNGSGLIPLNTSGTTGTSLKLVVDLASRRRTYAFTSRFHRWAGLKNSRHNITLGGRTIIPSGRETQTFWRYNAALDNYLFSSYHMSDRNLPGYVKKISAIQPQFIEAYPSAVYLLAKFMAENSLCGIQPKAVITSGETLFQHQRDVIERVFGCGVFDQYGCTEQALFVSQCEKGMYHVHPEYGIVEILDDDDRPLGVGKPGRVVCTSFLNQAMPLIRYDLGDVAEWDGNLCGCGRYFPVIKKILGRQDDYIKTPGGERIGRLDPVFKGVESVRLSQIVQKDLYNITVLVVPGKNFNETDKNKIIYELQSRVGPEMIISVTCRDSIPVSVNGKFKAVVSLAEP